MTPMLYLLESLHLTRDQQCASDEPEKEIFVTRLFNTVQVQVATINQVPYLTFSYMCTI